MHICCDFVLEVMMLINTSFLGFCSDEWVKVMTDCWNENPDERPTFVNILSRLRHLNGGKSLSLVDRMITKLENHTRHLEDIVSERWVCQLG